MTWIIRTVTLVAFGSMLLPGKQRKACRTHRSGILDAGNLMHFYDIHKPPQWVLCQPSMRKSVPLAHACKGIPYRHSRPSQKWHRSGVQEPLVSVLCLSLHYSECGILEYEPPLRFTYSKSPEYSTFVYCFIQPCVRGPLGKGFQQI